MIKPTSNLIVAIDPVTSETWTLAQLIAHANALEAQVEQLQDFCASKFTRAELAVASAEMAKAVA